MPHRVGKVKVFTAEGKLIREGQAREDDFSPKKIFGLFSSAEIVRSVVLIVVGSFTAGILWSEINSHFKSVDQKADEFLTSFDSFKREQMSFHKTIYDKLDAKETRINCLAEDMVACCPNSQRC